MPQLLVALKRVLEPSAAGRRRTLQFAGKQLRRRKKHAARNKRRVRRIEPLLEKLVAAATHILEWPQPIYSAKKDVLMLMARDPITVCLRPADEREARAQAQRIGLDPTTRIATLHAREPGWRPQEGEVGEAVTSPPTGSPSTSSSGAASALFGPAITV